MSKQEPQMVFVEPDTVPTRNKRKPKDYSKLFQKIPLNKVWKIKDGDKNFKISTIQEAAKKYENITATQRTVEGTRYLFVTRTGDV